MSNYNREALKQHCETTCEKFKDVPTSRVYMEHRLVLDLLEQTKWIPVSERLPENTDPVNITWVNHDPESYYADIKDKPFTATGHYCNGRWWWYSVTCQDYLDEYGHWDIDAMDDAIEVIAWMPLPEPYKGGK